MGVGSCIADTMARTLNNFKLDKNKVYRTPFMKLSFGQLIYFLLFRLLKLPIKTAWGKTKEVIRKEKITRLFLNNRVRVFPTFEFCV